MSKYAKKIVLVLISPEPNSVYNNILSSENSSVYGVKFLHSSKLKYISIDISSTRMLTVTFQQKDPHTIIIIYQHSHGIRNTERES